MNLKGASQDGNDEEKIKEIVDKGMKTLSVVARRIGSTARIGANVVATSEVAQATAQATTEAARFALDRTCEVFERATDPNYGAFWEPRVDRFSMIPWYERQLVEETCELPIEAAPPLLAMLKVHVPLKSTASLGQKTGHELETGHGGFHQLVLPSKAEEEGEEVVREKGRLISARAPGSDKTVATATNPRQSRHESSLAGDEYGRSGENIRPSRDEASVAEKDDDEDEDEGDNFHEMTSEPNCEQLCGWGAEGGGEGPQNFHQSAGTTGGDGGLRESEEESNGGNPARASDRGDGEGGCACDGNRLGCNDLEGTEEEEAAWLVVAGDERPLDPVPHAPMGCGGTAKSGPSPQPGTQPSPSNPFAAAAAAADAAAAAAAEAAFDTQATSPSGRTAEESCDDHRLALGAGHSMNEVRDPRVGLASEASAQQERRQRQHHQEHKHAGVTSHLPAAEGGADGGGGQVEEEEEEEEDSAYALAAQCIAAPPLWREQSRCERCLKSFGLTRYRHHCRACGGSFCHAHASRAKALPRMGFLTPVRCCDGCYAALETLERSQRVAWRAARLDAFQAGKLIPYFDLAVDTHAHKARRLLEGTLLVARRVPLGASATITVEVMDILWKYGPPGLAGLVLRREFIEAAELLRKVSNVEKSWPLSAHELMASLYYLLALKRGERGSDPDAEKRAHDEHDRLRRAQQRRGAASPRLKQQQQEWQRQQQEYGGEEERKELKRTQTCGGSGGNDASNDEVDDDEGCDTEDCGDALEVRDEELRRVLEVAPFALHFVYSPSSPEMQLRAAQRGHWLLFAKQEALPEEPAFALFARPSSSSSPPPPPPSSSSSSFSSTSSSSPGSGGVAVLSVRGTSDIYDVVTDIRVNPVPFPPPQPSRKTEKKKNQKQPKGATAATCTTATGTPPKTTPLSGTRRSQKQQSSPRSARDEEGQREAEIADDIEEEEEEGQEGGLGEGWATGLEEFKDVARTCAVQGMANAAVWLMEEVGQVLSHLSSEGYEIVLCGHSLGGAVAALLGVLVKRALPDTARVRVVTFGSPCCMDVELARSVAPFTTSVVLHDDLVPRVTPASVRSLVAELLRQRQGMVGLWHADLEAVFGRVKGFWTPRWRDSFLRGQDPHRPFDVSAKGLRSPSTSTDTFPNTASSSHSSSGGHDGLPTAHASSSSSSSQQLQRHQQQQPELAVGQGLRVVSASVPIGTGAGGHDGADLRNRFLLANDNAKALKQRQQQQQQRPQHGGSPSSAPEVDGVAKGGGRSSLEDALARGLNQRNSMLLGAARHRARPSGSGGAQDGGGSGERNEEEEEEEEYGGLAGCNRSVPWVSSPSSMLFARPFRVGDRVKAWGIAVEPESNSSSNNRGKGDGSSDRGEGEEPTSASPLLPPSSLGGGGLAVVADDEFGAVRAGWYDATVAAVESFPSSGSSSSSSSNSSRASGGLCGVAVSFADPAVRPAVSSAGDPAWKKAQGGGAEGGAEEGDKALVFLPALLVQHAGKGGGGSLDEEGGEEEEEAVSDGAQSRGPDGGCTSSSGGTLFTQGSSSAPMASPPTPPPAAAAAATIVVDDVELPALRVPGRVLHLYSYRGVYLVSPVSRDSPILTEISLYGNMLADHAASRYFEALCEALDVRSAPAPPPPWKPFSSADRCECCRAVFSWHATARQGRLDATCRDKHHCRCCGGLVCDPCSAQRRTLPRLGLNTSAQRVCDRCFFNADAISSMQSNLQAPASSSVGGEQVLSGGMGATSRGGRRGDMPAAAAAELACTTNAASAPATTGNPNLLLAVEHSGTTTNPHTGNDEVPTTSVSIGTTAMALASAQDESLQSPGEQEKNSGVDEPCSGDLLLTPQDATRVPNFSRGASPKEFPAPELLNNISSTGSSSSGSSNSPSKSIQGCGTTSKSAEGGGSGGGANSDDEEEDLFAEDEGDAWKTGSALAFFDASARLSGEDRGSGWAGRGDDEGDDEEEEDENKTTDAEQGALLSLGPSLIPFFTNPPPLPSNTEGGCTADLPAVFGSDPRDGSDWSGGLAPPAPPSAPAAAAATGRATPGLLDSSANDDDEKMSALLEADTTTRTTGVAALAAAATVATTPAGGCMLPDNQRSQNMETLQNFEGALESGLSRKDNEEGEATSPFRSEGDWFSNLD